jgi:hypothetical protein
MALLMLYPIFCLFQAYRSPLWYIPGPKVTRRGSLSRTVRVFTTTRCSRTAMGTESSKCTRNTVCSIPKHVPCTKRRLIGFWFGMSGRIVRINPNEVHINDPKFHLGFGQGRLKKKDPWYYTVGLPRATGTTFSLG